MTNSIESNVTANTDSMGLKLAQDAGRPSATQAQRGEFLEACRSAEDADESEALRQAHTIIKSINRSSSLASVPLATNIVQTEEIHEVPFIGTATQDTGWVKRWFKDRSFHQRLEARTYTSIGNSWSVPRCRNCGQYTSHITFFSCLRACVIICHTTLAQVFVRVISSMSHAPVCLISLRPSLRTLHLSLPSSTSSS